MAIDTNYSASANARKKPEEKKAPEQKDSKPAESKAESKPAAKPAAKPVEQKTQEQKLSQEVKKQDSYQQLDDILKEKPFQGSLQFSKKDTAVKPETAAVKEKTAIPKAEASAKTEEAEGAKAKEEAGKKDPGYIDAPSDKPPELDGSGSPNGGQIVPNKDKYTKKEEEALRTQLVDDYGLNPELAKNIDLNGYTWQATDPSSSYTVDKYKIDSGTQDLVDGINQGWEAMPESFRKAYKDSNTTLVLSNDKVLDNGALASTTYGQDAKEKDFSMITMASGEDGKDAVAHSFAHESAHVIDNKLGISSSPEFKAAYQKDLQEAMDKGIPLTEEYGMDALNNYDWSEYMGSEAFANIMAGQAAGKGASKYHDGTIQNAYGQTENLFNNTEKYLKGQGMLDKGYDVQQDAKDFQYGDKILMDDVVKGGKAAGLGDADLGFIDQWSKDNPGKSLHFGQSLFDNFGKMAGDDRLLTKQELQDNAKALGLNPDEAKYLMDNFDTADVLEGIIAKNTEGQLSSNGSAKADGKLSYEDIFYLMTVNKFFAY